ncbi:hypothetical protein RU93_GL001233 [Enterococcus aquimarinus]|uniref:Uncharacterized protein n=1 Tax=Enterococcus aquimarinus TaxID=328396 RepID=A0A1L8QNH8_9ENTE|nr:hypothetical protein RU93_GL001233 [Enterococcus aquimarinus]
MDDIHINILSPDIPSSIAFSDFSLKGTIIKNQILLIEFLTDFAHI